MRAIIQADENIRSIPKLELDAFFRCQNKFSRRRFWPEYYPILTQAAKFCVLADKGVRLKAARVRHDDTVPGSHAMQSAQRLYDR